MSNRVSFLALLLAAGGCESAEAKCNAAKVSAYEAWTAYAAAADRQPTGSPEYLACVQQARSCTKQPVNVLGVGWVDPCDLEEGNCEASHPGNPYFVPRSPQIRPLAEAAQGRAIPLKEATDRFNRQWSTRPGAEAEYRAAIVASTRHWDACREVAP